MDILKGDHQNFKKQLIFQYYLDFPTSTLKNYLTLFDTIEIAI